MTLKWMIISVIQLTYTFVMDRRGYLVLENVLGFVYISQFTNLRVLCYAATTFDAGAACAITDVVQKLWG